LKLFNIPRSVLPEVKPSSKIYGTTANAVPEIKIPIAGIAGDQQAALFGQMCTTPGMVKNTYGTGCLC
jgi:glycerol kinase